LSLKLAARLVVLEPAKILDLQENDTVVHTEDLSAFVPPATKAILIGAARASGTGYFLAYPNSGSTYAVNADTVNQKSAALIPIKNQELVWKNTVANDDWDVFLYAYFVQPRTR